jgi:hypothetical protein
MCRHLEAGYTMVKMKVGGSPPYDDLRGSRRCLEVTDDRSRAAIESIAIRVRGALTYADALTARVRRTLRSARP